jgi:glutaconate CoA-transferase subunit B
MSSQENPYTPDEMMAVAAARKFQNRSTCFVGVGLPSIAACVARRLHAPDVTLVYESGAIGAKPTVVPLSIADLELAESATFLVSVPEIFSYWVQGGRMNMGVLGAAQIDRFGNLNTTVIGDYHSPRVRLPGAGGAPHIAANVGELVVILRHTLKAFVPCVDFLTTPRPKGHLVVVSDLGILETDCSRRELILTSRHPGVTPDEIRDATGWPLVVSDSLNETPQPTEQEILVLRELTARTAGDDDTDTKTQKQVAS